MPSVNSAGAGNVRLQNKVIDTRLKLSCDKQCFKLVESWYFQNADIKGFNNAELSQPCKCDITKAVLTGHILVQ